MQGTVQAETTSPPPPFFLLLLLLLLFLLLLSLCCCYSFDRCAESDQLFARTRTNSHHKRSQGSAIQSETTCFYFVSCKYIENNHLLSWHVQRQIVANSPSSDGAVSGESFRAFPITRHPVLPLRYFLLANRDKHIPVLFVLTIPK